MKLNKVLPILLGLAGLPAWADQGYWLEDRAAEPAAQLNACTKPAIPKGPQGSGFVRLAFQLLPDGRVAESKVLISSQSAAVDRAVMAALDKCVFRPTSPAADRWLSASYVTTATSPNDKSVPNASVKPTGVPAGQNVNVPIPVLMRPAPAGQRTAAVVDFSSCAKPVWPRQSLREEQTGTVTLRFLIGTDGWVQDSQVELTSGYPLLDFAALDGIERCRFKAATVNGVSQAGWQRMQYVWTLDGDPNDDGPALADLQSGIEKGDADARYRMALHQLNGGNALIAKNAAAALAALTSLADSGMVQAQEALGIAYLGHGVPRDASQAAKWLRKAAEQNAASAQFSLARLLQTGDGVLRNDREAFEWYEKAGRGGLPQAYLALTAMMLDSGDRAAMGRAVEWLQKQTLPGAQYMLAECYEYGRGVPQDIVRAKELYRLAEKGGKAKARQALQRLGEPTLPAHA